MSQIPLRQVPSGTGHADCGPIHHSKRGKWRALVLALITLLFVAHFIQWWLGGTTLSPIEPSEAMQTLEVGLVNAGFVFFGLAILSTLVFGRFFCGWGCHIVALQDLCGSVLKRVGIRPRPFRSRLLVYVPLFAALYMFAWPQILRLYAGDRFPALKAHFMTESFWETFPGPTVAILTFAVCGFLIVYLLGNKGFCTYACPYGGIFSYVDKAAPGKIRVTDACDQCGHCTATCSSNVKVSQEVHQFGMVVDSGCMKCMDCVDVCPKDALYFGFGKPELSKGKPKAAGPQRHFDYSWSEEIAMAVIFAGSFYAFRGLYEAVPLLLSIGLASISAFVIISGARIAYMPAVRLQRSQLKTPKGLTGYGLSYLIFCAIFLVFTVHSAVVQYHSHEGERLLTAAQDLYDKGSGSDPKATENAKSALSEYQWVTSNGLLEVAAWQGKLGAIEMFLGNYPKSIDHLNQSLKLDTQQPNVLRSLAQAQEAQGDPTGALRTWTQLYSLRPTPENAYDLGSRLLTANNAAKAEPLLAKASEGMPSEAGVWKLLGKSQAALGNQPAAMMSLGKALDLSPKDAESHYLFGLALGSNHQAEALKEFREAAELDPNFFEPRFVMGKIEFEARNYVGAAEHLEEARMLQPDDPAVLSLWAEAQVKSNRARSLLFRLIRSPVGDDASWYAAALLYGKLGEKEQSLAILERLKRRDPSNPGQ